MFAAVPVSDDRRSSDRLPVGRAAVLRVGEFAEEIELLDLTGGGCRFRCKAKLPLLARVSIGIAGVGHNLATIAWADETSYGCAFDRPIPNQAVTADAPDNVAKILTRTRALQSEFEGDLSDDEPLPIQLRVAVISGLTGGLWALIIGGARALYAHFS